MKREARICRIDHMTEAATTREAPQSPTRPLNAPRDAIGAVKIKSGMKEEVWQSELMNE